MAPPRKSPGMRLVIGDRKPGETARRTARVTALPTTEPPDPPVPLSDEALAVWERVAPLMHSRHLLTDENADLLARYCEAAAIATEAQRLLAAGILVTGHRGALRKNPAHQIWRDASSVMRSLAATLHLNELGLGADANPNPAERLLS